MSFLCSHWSDPSQGSHAGALKDCCPHAEIGKHEIKSPKYMTGSRRRFRKGILHWVEFMNHHCCLIFK